MDLKKRKIADEENNEIDSDDALLEVSFENIPISLLTHSSQGFQERSNLEADEGV